MRYTKFTSPLSSLSLVNQKVELQYRLVMILVFSLLSAGVAIGVKFYYPQFVASDAAAALFGILSVLMLSFFPSHCRMLKKVKSKLAT